MAQAQSMKMKDVEESIKKGLFQFYYDMTVEKVTNT